MKKKITDEMIMDFADGVLSESDSRLVIKHIKKDKRSMEKFLKFQKTSMLFGSKNEKFYDNQPIPKSTLELITSEENRNKKSTEIFFLDSIKNYISDFNLKQNFAVAVCALFIGFFSHNFIEQDNIDNPIFRSVDIEKIDEIKLVEIISKKNSYQLGDFIPLGEKFKIIINSPLNGELVLNFPDDQMSFSKTVIKNEQIVFPDQEEKSLIASAPYIFFEIKISNKKKIFIKKNYFVVK